jgi:hypothetical protein
MDLHRNEHCYIIFDYDFTLFPTKNVVRQGCCSISGLKEHDMVVRSLLLESLLATPNVSIVTNSMSGWVMESSRLYMPFTHEVIKKMGIDIYENPPDAYPSREAMVGLKYRAFSEILSKDLPSTYVIVVGDMDIEKEAAEKIRLAKPFIKLQFIKFDERCSCIERIKTECLAVRQFIKEKFVRIV